MGQEREIHAGARVLNSSLHPIALRTFISLGGNFDVKDLLACLHPKNLLPLFACKHVFFAMRSLISV